MKKQIVLIHYAAPPVVGGVESVLGHHACLLADNGHDVRVVAGRGAQIDARIPFILLPLADSRHPDILKLKVELDAGRVSLSFNRITEVLVEELSEICVGVDYIIAHNVCSLAKNLPLTAALSELSSRPNSPQLILWHHDLAWTTPRYQAELHNGYPWDLLRTDWPGVTQVVVSRLRQQELADLMGVSLERIRVVPNGVDMGKFLKLEDQTRKFIDQLDLVMADPLLLLPVRITPRKNIEMALEIISQLRQTFPQVKLVVTGPLGPHNPANVKYFEKLVKQRAHLGLERSVSFLAELTDQYLPDSVIADFYHLADALLMPSQEEGFGIPILEAGLAGLPVFCADIPPLRELGGERVEYFLLDADPNQVAELIRVRLSYDPVFAQRVHVRNGYTWERIYQEHIAPLIGSDNG